MISVSQHAFNNKALSRFRELIYCNFLNEDNIVGSEVAVMVNGIKEPGFVLKKELTSFFLRTSDLDRLPIKVKQTERVIDGKQVYHFITSFSHLELEGKDEVSFRWLVDSFCNFKHSKPVHFTLWKIIVIAAYVSRVNFRLATPPAFGKDSCVDALHDLINNAVRIDKATFAKLEYVLKYSFIVCNEVAGLSDVEKRELESFGLSAGAFQNTYVKRSRRSRGTKEVYDISKLSLGFTYNDKACYAGVGRKGFDSSFPKQFLDRFLPLKMSGSLDVSWFGSDGSVDWEVEVEQNMKVYQAVIQKLQWLVSHPLMERWSSEWDVKDDQKGRHTKSFKTVCCFISHYAESKEEYLSLCGELYKCYTAYLSEETEEYSVMEEDVK